jgi:hypothetical protein
LDGISVRELLLPSSVLRDGNAGFGYPWEFNYTLRSWPNISSSSPFTGGYWIKSKAGDAPGYHSQIAMQQDLKLGLFFVTMEEEVPEPTNSLFTIPALDILIPAFLEVVWPLQPTYSPPANTQV